MHQHLNTRFCRAFVAPLLFLGLAITSPAASWTPLTNLMPPGTFGGTMLLLTDGTVMVSNQVNGSYDVWLKLTPDSHGSYINGTWTTLASMSIQRLYFASVILPSGKLWVLGGEYSAAHGLGISANFNRTGEIYDPVANSWSAITSYPNASFGDDPAALLPNGKIIAGDISTNQPQIYDIASNTWAAGPHKVYNDRSDEESWAKRGDGKVMVYDLFMAVNDGTHGFAEVYDPTANTWASVTPFDGTANGTLGVLSSSALGFEMGPLLRLQDGRMFQLGANQHTALYTPGTNTWAAGPDIIHNGTNFGADDAPGVVMPNGHVLFTADEGPSISTFSPPTQVFDFDPVAGTISDASPAFPVSLASTPAFVTRMLMLPNGQVLFNFNSNQLYVYTPNGTASPALRPIINNVAYNGGGVFTLTGSQLNGQSAGSAYGDDVGTDENFPVIRLIQGTTQVYCKTSNWSATGVDGSGSQTVNFTLGGGVQPGNYYLVVSGAGIQSNPMVVNITAAEVAGQ